MDKKQALEAMERIFNYCEEIDLHLPENERTGYNMLPDVQLVERYILSKDEPGSGEMMFTTEEAAVRRATPYVTWRN